MGHVCYICKKELKWRMLKITYDEIFSVQNFCTDTVRRVLSPIPQNTPTSTIPVEQLKTTILRCQSRFYPCNDSPP